MICVINTNYFLIIKLKNDDKNISYVYKKTITELIFNI